MKLNLSFIIALATVTAGFATNNGVLIPATILVASVIDLLLRRWALSDSVGEWQTVSMALKIMANLIIIYATVGIAINLYFLITWFV